MTQSISINYSTLEPSTIDSFLSAWNQIGRWEPMKTNVYKLIGNNNEKSVLSIQQSLIRIDGNIPENAKELISQLSEHLQGSAPEQQVQTEYVEVLEGEFIDKDSKNQSQQQQFKSQFQAQFQQFQWSQLPLKSKIKFGIFMLLAIPLLLILIPLAIVITLIRVVMFKLFYR